MKMHIANSLLTGILVCLIPAAHADVVRVVGSEAHLPVQTSTTLNISPDLSLARSDQPGMNSFASDAGVFGLASNGHEWKSTEHGKLNLRSDFALGTDASAPAILISPRFSELTTNDLGIKSYSAEIRLGNVVQFERGTDTSGWFVFAAADGEALSINTRSLSGFNGSPMSVSLDDQITVGDLQAGISTYRWGTQLTLSYIETEASFSSPGGMSNSKKESFAGISMAKSF